MIDEIEEMIADNKSNLFFSNTTSKAIHVLNNNRIDVLILDLDSMSDAGLLKYINEYFPQTNLILAGENDILNLILNFRKMKFKILPKNFSIKEFRNTIFD